ncbi:MAG: hypothetical protein ACT6QJ_10035 [Aeromicrobium sp.]
MYVLIAATVLLVVSALTFVIASRWNFIADRAWLEASINQLAGLLVATGLITVLWELLGKRRFASELFGMASLSSDVVDAGLERITDQYLEDVAWADLFQGASHLDVVVAYARTWRNNHLSRLKDLAAKPGAHLRFFLPDPSDDPTMTLLADRFGKGVEEMRAVIREAIEEYSKLDSAGAGSVEVFVRPGDYVFSAYRFDGRAVLAMYSHTRRRVDVPTFVANGGKIFAFVKREIDSIQSQSHLVFPPPAPSEVK